VTDDGSKEPKQKQVLYRRIKDGSRKLPVTETVRENNEPVSTVPAENGRPCPPTWLHHLLDVRRNKRQAR